MVIRQSISCDICKAEKKQSNHWFVAYEHGAELRVGGWNSRYRTRPGAKHLCGQTCLHKLMDEFLARVVVMKAPPESESVAPTRARVAADTSLTSNAAYIDVESVRLVKPAAELVTMPGKTEGAERLAQLDESPRYGTRNWRAEAWERELEREQQETESRPDLMARHGL
jgi:hypothetical protein